MSDVPTDGIAEEFNRMVDGFSSLMESQQRDLGRGMRVISQEFERAVQRFSDALANVPGATTGSPAAAVAAPAAAVGAGMAAGGVVSVLVVNDDSQAVPIRRVEPGTGFANVFGGILGGIGSFFGNLIGGAASGFMAPVTSLVLGAGVIAFMAQLRGLVNQIRDFTGFLIGGLAWFLRELFTSLYQAGVFPVSRLIASLLVLLDYGLTLVLRHLLPFLDWARQVVEVSIEWAGQLMNRLTRWLDRFIENLVEFLIARGLYLATQVVRRVIEATAGAAGAMSSVLMLAFRHGAHLLASAINGLTSNLMAVTFGLIEGLAAGLRAGAAHLRHALVSAANSVLSRLGLPTVPTTPPRVGIGDAARTGFRTGMVDGRARAQSLLLPTTAPTETFGQAIREGYQSGAGFGEGIANRLLGPDERPNLVVPGIRMPDLALPEAPDVSPQLRRLIEEESTARRAEGSEAGGVTLNGNVNVEVQTDSIDAANTDLVARDLAERLMAELDRLSRQERFGRGLVT